MDRIASDFLFALQNLQIFHGSLEEMNRTIDEHAPDKLPLFWNWLRTYSCSANKTMEAFITFMPCEAIPYLGATAIKTFLQRHPVLYDLLRSFKPTLKRDGTCSETRRNTNHNDNHNDGGDTNTNHNNDNDGDDDDDDNNTNINHNNDNDGDDDDDDDSSSSKRQRTSPSFHLTIDNEQQFSDKEVKFIVRMHLARPYQQLIPPQTTVEKKTTSVRMAKFIVLEDGNEFQTLPYLLQEELLVQLASSFSKKNPTDLYKQKDTKKKFTALTKQIVMLKNESKILEVGKQIEEIVDMMAAVLSETDVNDDDGDDTNTNTNTNDNGDDDGDDNNDNGDDDNNARVLTPEKQQYLEDTISKFDAPEGFLAKYRDLLLQRMTMTN
jgi:hypothetical protein